MLNPGLHQQIHWTHPLNRNHPLSRGLLARWLCVPGQLGFGSYSWRDLRGVNHGTLTSMTPAGAWGGAAGRPGGWGALRFNESGTDDYVAATVSSIVGASQHTFAAWVRILVDTGDRQTVIRIGQANGRSRRIDFREDGSIASNYFLDGTIVSATGIWAVGTWYRVVATQTSSTQALYLNGRLLQSTSNTPPAFDSGECFIGRRVSSATTQYPCNAMLDDVVVANRAWSNSEAALDYRLGKQYLGEQLNRWNSVWSSVPASFQAAWASGATRFAGWSHA